MGYFAAMRVFTRAADLGSFSKAAAKEGIKISTGSRYVSALEADLGAVVFNRSTRHLHLTVWADGTPVNAGLVFAARLNGVPARVAAWAGSRRPGA